MNFINKFLKTSQLFNNFRFIDYKTFTNISYINMPKYLKDELINFQNEKLNEFDRINSLIQSQSLSNRDLLEQYGRLSSLVDIFNDIELVNVDEQYLNNSLLDSDTEPEMADLMRLESNQLSARRDALYSKLISMVIPHNDLNEASEISMDILSGAGGQESMLFAEDLLNAYKKFATAKNWIFEEVNINYCAEMGGIRSCKVNFSGNQVYNCLKYESGVHRVQRVPITSSQGKIHTSTVAVIVLPVLPDDVVEIKESDIKFESFKSSGPGGQHVNTTDSAVRLVHIPTKIVVSCQKEKIQQQNKKTAMQQLKDLLIVKQYEEKMNRLNSHRKIVIGTRSRSDKIRTYNYTQDRITEHRIHKNFSNIQNILNQGYFDEIIKSLQEFDEFDQLELALRNSTNCKQFIQ